MHTHRNKQTRRVVGGGPFLLSFVAGLASPLLWFFLTQIFIVHITASSFVSYNPVRGFSFFVVLNSESLFKASSLVGSGPW
jgi:hypothetical protein